MIRQAEKVEDSIRDRIQIAKDEIWDEFAAQVKGLSSEIRELREADKSKDEAIAALKEMVAGLV